MLDVGLCSDNVIILYAALYKCRVPVKDEIVPNQPPPTETPLDHPLVHPLRRDTAQWRLVVKETESERGWIA